MNLRSQEFASKLGGIFRARWLCLICWMICPVCFGQAPPNDDFTNAIPLYGSSVTFTGTLDNATFESGENPCACYNCFGPYPSLWWSWTATNSTTVLIMSVQGSAMYSGFGVHTGTNVSTLTDLSCNLLDSRTNRYACFAATEGTTYFIRVIGYGGSFALRLIATNSPAILTPPQDQTVPESSSAFFSVFAAGLRPLSYQWQFEGNNLAGQTTPCLVQNYVGTSQAGGYSVIVSNVSGVITSAVANLTISPTNPPLVLGAVSSPDTNRFHFSIAGEAGRSYRVMATTNLVNWSDEESLRWADIWSEAVVLNMNTTSVFSIPMVSTQKFLRVSHSRYTEICIANLREIDFAVRLWVIEAARESSDPVTFNDIAPYLNFNAHNVVCPARGTTFSDSYTIYTANAWPFCQKSPAQHKLPFPP